MRISGIRSGIDQTSEGELVRGQAAGTPTDKGTSVTRKIRSFFSLRAQTVLIHLTRSLPRPSSELTSYLVIITYKTTVI